MKEAIERAIRETLVVENKQSIGRAADKILALLTPVDVRVADPKDYAHITAAKDTYIPKSIADSSATDKNGQQFKPTDEVFKNEP